MVARGGVTNIFEVVSKEAKHWRLADKRETPPPPMPISLVARMATCRFRNNQRPFTATHARLTTHCTQHYDIGHCESQCTIHHQHPNFFHAHRKLDRIRTPQCKRSSPTFGEQRHQCDVFVPPSWWSADGRGFRSNCTYRHRS